MRRNLKKINIELIFLFFALRDIMCQSLNFLCLLKYYYGKEIVQKIISKNVAAMTQISIPSLINLPSIKY